MSHSFTRFEITAAERARIEAVSSALAAAASEIGGNFIHSLRSCEPGNANAHAWHQWCGSNGYAKTQRKEIDALLAELDEAFEKPRQRARRILSKRIRKPRKEGRAA